MILPAVKTWLVKVVDVFEGKCFLLESLKEFSEQKFNEDLALNIFRQFWVKWEVFFILDRYNSILFPFVVEKSSDIFFKVDINLNLIIKFSQDSKKFC